MPVASPTAVYEALKAGFDADAALTALAPLWFAEAPENRAFPYCVMYSIGNDVQARTSDGEYEQELIQLSVWDQTAVLVAGHAKLIREHFQSNPLSDLAHPTDRVLSLLYRGQNLLREDRGVFQMALTFSVVRRVERSAAQG